MSAPLLEITGLTAHSLRERAAILSDVSLEISAGQVHGLVGESGAGKSTIAKVLLGLLPGGIRVTGGVAQFQGRDLLTLDEKARRAICGADITLIPQDPLSALNPGRRIGPQLTDGLRLRRGLDRKAANAKAMTLLDEVMIRDPERVVRLYPHELSGGMRQRVLIAAAFSLEPKLVVADEPTTALDVTVQKEVLRLIRALQSRHGTSVLFVTHDLGVVAKICDSVTLLFMGRVVEQGPTSEILSAPRRPYTRALLAAGPRYDRPDAGLEPVPESVLSALRAELAAAKNHA
jgi:peptide/nickel transport system ATP-binding protein